MLLTIDSANWSDDGRNMESIHRCCKHSALRIDSSPGQSKRCLLCISQRGPQRDAFLDDGQKFQPVTNLHSTLELKVHQRFCRPSMVFCPQKGLPWPCFFQAERKTDRWGSVPSNQISESPFDTTLNMMQPMASHGLSIVSNALIFRRTLDKLWVHLLRKFKSLRLRSTKSSTPLQSTTRLVPTQDKASERVKHVGWHRGGISLSTTSDTSACPVTWRSMSWPKNANNVSKV